MSVVKSRAMADSENGTQWFFRYVFVPIVVAVVGGGGLVAILNYGKTKDDNKKPNIAPDTKATQPASEQQDNGSSASQVTASHVPVRMPVKASEPPSDGQASDGSIDATCFAENIDSHQRLSMLTNLPKYTDVKIYWSVPNLPPETSVYGVFGEEAGLAATEPRIVEPRGSTEYANVAGRRSFMLETMKNGKTQQIICTYLMNFILDN